MAHRRPGKSERPGGGFFIHGRGARNSRVIARVCSRRADKNQSAKPQWPTRGIALRSRLPVPQLPRSLRFLKDFRLITTLVAALAIGGKSVAFDGFSLETSFAASLIAQADTAEAEPLEEPASAFGKKDTWRWMVQGGAGIDVRDSSNVFGLVGGGISYFIIDDLSLDLELNGMYFSQISDDAVGVNFALLFRWHFVAEEKWSIYFDAGAGLLAATAKVPGPTPDEPRGGSSFNFTPQGGFGFTVEIAENTRFFAGARIYHISNAQVYEGNPGRDSIFIYAGVSIPF